MSSTRVQSIFLEHFSNSAQFLNITCVAAFSGWGSASATAAAVVLVAIIFPGTKIYASE